MLAGLAKQQTREATLKLIIPLVLCAGAFLFIVGCSQEEATTAAFRPAADGKFYGGTFRVNETGELRSLDPVRINDATSAHIAEQIYDGLLYIDENLQLQPALAKRWEVSEDGLTYTYHLRTDVYFHDNPCFPNGKGRRLTAFDVEYCFHRLCDFRSGTIGVDYFRGKVLGADAYYEATKKAATENVPLTVSRIEGFKALNDSTFQIRLLKPFAPFEYYVALSFCYIYPKEAVEFYKQDFFKNPVGSGPFIFEYWKPDQELRLRRNPNYWMRDSAGNQLPFLDAIVFSFIKDNKTQLLEFRQGNLEECYRIPSEFFPDIIDENKQAKGEYKKYQLFRVPALSTQYYGMLTTSDIFKDKRVRQAFCYAVDRERIIRYVLHGQAAGPAHYGLVPPSMPDYPAERIRGYRFDPEKAQQLLAEAGYPGGKGFPEITLQLNSGGGRNVQIAEAIQSMLQENLGITVHLKQVEWARHLEEIDAGKAPFFRLGWIADYPDPENFLNLLYGKLVPPDGGISPINSTRYQNPEFDRIFEQALQTLDKQERMKLYLQAEQIAINDAPMLLIFYDEDYRFVQPYVRDYRNNSMDRRLYKFVWFDPKQYEQSQ